VPVYKRPVFQQSSPKLDLILNINVLESSPSASPFPPLLHKPLRVISSSTRDFYLFKYLPPVHLLVQVILSRPVEALIQVKLSFRHTSLVSRPLQTFTNPAIPSPPHPHQEVMTTLANNARTYAAVAAMKSAPHIQDQKATGRPKGITTTGRSTTGVGAIKLTTDQSYQGTTGSPMGETKAHKKTQPQGDTKAMLHKALYEIFNIKALIVMETKDPIKVNALCFAGKYHHHGIASQVNHMFYKSSMQPQDNGHKHAPPTNKLIRSLECFHCHKKGHYARHC